MNPGAVTVGYLMRPDELSPSFHLSIMDLWLWDLRHHSRILGGGGHAADFCGTGRLPDGRNEIVQRFLASDSEWLFMVDADMAFPADTVDRLVAAADPDTAPVVGGLCLGMRIVGVDDAHMPQVETFPTMYRIVTVGDETGFAPFDTYPENQLVQVAATGAACLLVHRSAAERVQQGFGPTWFSQLGHAGEDMSFCLRLANCEIPVHVHTGIRVGHQKAVHLVPSIVGGGPGDGTGPPPAPAP